jgi:hypothetical protein
MHMLKLDMLTPRGTSLGSFALPSPSTEFIHDPPTV